MAMLRRIRRHLRPVATALLALLVAVGGTSSVGHGSDCHADECAVGIFPHDASQHGFSRPSTDAGHPLHCVLCHWTRSVRPSTEAAHHLARPVADDVQIYQEVFGALSLVQAAQPPLRSPPLI